MNLRDIFLAGAFAQGGGAVSPEQITEAVNNYLDENPVGVDLAMTGAAVGQIAKITAVDASGVPTAWEPVAMPSGGGGEEWELITSYDFAELGGVVECPVIDVSGYKEIAVYAGNITGDIDCSFNVFVNGGSTYQGIPAKKDSPASGMWRIGVAGYVYVDKNETSQPYNTPSSINRTVGASNGNVVAGGGFSRLGTKLETVQLKTNTHPYKIVGGTAEVWGLKA